MMKKVLLFVNLMFLLHFSYAQDDVTIPDRKSVV